MLQLVLMRSQNEENLFKSYSKVGPSLSIKLKISFGTFLDSENLLAFKTPYFWITICCPFRCFQSLIYFKKLNMKNYVIFVVLLFTHFGIMKLTLGH